MKINNIQFLEEFSQHDIQKSITIDRGKIIDYCETNLKNNATRIIDKNKKVGLHICSGEFNREESYKNAVRNASFITVLPSIYNNFVNQEYLDDITLDCTQKDYCDFLKSKLSSLNSFNSKFKVIESHTVNQLENSYGARTYSNIKRTDIILELRDKQSERLFINRKYNSKDFINILDFLSTVSDVPRIEKGWNLKDKMFILSPNILLEFLYPLQSLLLDGLSITDEINKTLNITEENIGILQIPFDDEGVKTQKKVIYQNGNIVPTTFKCLNNGVSTGNGFRKSYRQSPKKSPLIWHVLPGSMSLEKLKKEAKESILIDTMVQGRIDERSGYLISTVINSYLVKDGEIKGILPQFKIAADPIALIEDTELIISKEVEFTEGGDFLLPYMLTDKIFILPI